MSQALVEHGSDNGRHSVSIDEPPTGDGAIGPMVTARRPLYRRTVFSLVLFVIAAGVTVGLLYWLQSRQFESTDDAFIDGHVIPIGPQVSARVAEVHVSDNQLVRKGDLLVELDPTDYDVVLAQAKGAEAATRGKLEQARAQVMAAEAGRDEARAVVDVAQANYQMADQDLRRYQALDERARSRQQYDSAAAAQKSARATVEQAKAKLASAESQIATARAAVTAAEGDVAKAAADVRRANVNIEYCRVTAPEDGRITRKNVEPGAYVTTGQSLFALVPSDVWVVANFKETQLRDMRPGQPVTIEVDAYPDREFAGHVDSIQAGTGSRFSVLPAENATGNFVKVVQRVPVKISFDRATADDSRVLAPGMSVEPKVRVR